MNVITILHTLNALSGIAIITFGSLRLKQYLKCSLCF